MHKRNHFHASRHPWPPIHQRTAGGANWHQAPAQEQQAQPRLHPQEERYREIVRQRQAILAQMDGAGCIGWGVAAAVVALLVAVVAFVVWS